MDYLIASLLGFIQGATEFLPVSSSGHLVIIQSLFNISDGGLLLDTILHLGTALAIIFVFRNDILTLLSDSIGKDAAKRTSALSYIGFLVIATIPAAVFGVLFNDYFEALFSNPKAAGSMLIVTAGVLFISAFRKDDGGPVTLMKAVLIGFAQACAIMPGLSRSGSTIAIALLVGVARDRAGKFSFLLALPAIFGAALLQARKIDTIDMQIISVILGFFISFFVGIAALRLLMRFVQKGKLYYFGFYCLMIGIVSIVFFK